MYTCVLLCMLIYIIYVSYGADKHKRTMRISGIILLLLPAAINALSLPKPLVGIIFDMDGTLTQPCIDFSDMRRRIYELASEDAGVPVTQGDVVTMVETFSPLYQKKAEEVFNDIQAKALRDMKLMPGMLELCNYLDDNNIRRAVLTRNVESSVQHLQQHFMATMPLFDPQVARDTLDENGQILLPKPYPDGIQYICRRWQCSPSQTIMIGDSELDDIVAGYRAGCGATIHLATSHDNDSGNSDESLLDERRASVRIDSLATVRGLLEVALNGATSPLAR